MDQVEEAKKGKSLLSFAGTLFLQTVISALFTFLFFYIIVSFVAEDIALIISTVLGVGLMLWLSFSSGGDAAAKDFNLVKYGHRGKNLLRGFLAGLLSQVPGLVLAVLTVLHVADWPGVVLRILYNSCLWFLTFAETLPALNFLPLVMIPLGGGLGYLLGYRRTQILSDRENSLE